MTIQLFDKPYKSCSNLFVDTYTGEEYCFPSPFFISATIENETKKTTNKLELGFVSFNESPLILDYSFSLFFFVLNFEYKIESFYFPVLMKQESNPESFGYKGIYTFNSQDVISNIGNTEIYDDYIKIQASIQND